VRMAKAYSNDLRRRFLSAYEQGEGTLEELAERFMVSLDYGKKLRRQFLRSGLLAFTVHFSIPLCARPLDISK
jgi:transposase